MSDIHVPNGFKKLVEMAEIQRFKSKKSKTVKNDEEMWSHFCWAVLLGGNRTEAEVNYVFEILDNNRLLERSNLSSDWLVDAANVLSDAKDDISNDEDNADGKISAIKKIKVEISNIETTLKSADEIFNRRISRIDADYLQKIATCKNPKKKIDEENKLIADIASKDENWYLHAGTKHPYKIPGIAYTKAILWMHGCGIGLDYIPDNNHSVKFLKECNPQWTAKEFFLINHEFRKVCDEISTEILYSGWSLWIYESTKNLINGYKKKQSYQPAKMIEIMQDYDMGINDVADMLADIESVIELEDILNEY